MSALVDNKSVFRNVLSSNVVSSKDVYKLWLEVRIGV